MERILTDGKSVRDSFSELILQPQSDISHFRRFIQSQGWEITEEKMVEEDGKFYPMMRVVKIYRDAASEAEALALQCDSGEMAAAKRMRTPYTLEEAFGKYLLKEHNRSEERRREKV